jgi:hypothetical protein
MKKKSLDAAASASASASTQILSSSSSSAAAVSSVSSSTKPTSSPTKKEKEKEEEEHSYSAAEVKDFDQEECMRRLGDINIDDSGIRISLQDFGGQPVFYSFHHLFINRYSFFVIMFNMGDLLSTSQAKIRHAKQCLQFWIESITIHTITLNKTAQVVFVGTHKDKYNNPADHDKIHTIISELVESVPPIAANMLKNLDGEGAKGTTTHYFYPVDNTIGTSDPTIVALMDAIVSNLKEAPHVIQKKPVTWLKFVDLIKERQAEATYITYPEAWSIARSVGVPDKDLDHLLTFLHDMSILMWFNEGFLKETIILDPFEFLVKAITTVVCKHTTTDDDPTNHSTSASDRCKLSHVKDWRAFMSKAVITRALLLDLLDEWSMHANVIIQLMINFGLMVPLVSNEHESHDAIDAASYIIPCLLTDTQTPYVRYRTLSSGKQHSFCVFIFTVTDLLDLEARIELNSIAKDACLPTGLFSRLLGKVVLYIRTLIYIYTHTYICSYIYSYIHAPLCMFIHTLINTLVYTDCGSLSGGSGKHS